MSISTEHLPSGLDRARDLQTRIGKRRLAVFLDYDGTLTPIVEKPEDAVLSDQMRQAVKGLADIYKVAVISGRDREDVEKRVGLDNLYYAGSHGFDIAGPRNSGIQSEKGTEFLPVLDETEKELLSETSDIPNAQIERKRFSIAIHYRRVAPERYETLKAKVQKITGGHGELRLSEGKKVFQIQPDIEWNKGHAVNFLLREIGLEETQTIPLYIGDDLTDEDAFRALSGRGLCIVVRDIEPRPTEAEYALEDTSEVEKFLTMLIQLGSGGHA